MGYYAAFLGLTDQRGLVLGGGGPALAKVHGLLEAGARVSVVAEEFVPELEGLGRDGRITLLRRRFDEVDLEGCALVIDASGDPALGPRVSAAARARKVLVNVLDRPELCDFIAPALVRRGPLQIAISTSGRSPYLASAIRRYIERWLGAEWGQMVELTGRLRDRLRRRGLPLSEQLPAYARVFGSRALEFLRDGGTEAAETEVDRSLNAATGRVALVGAGPGDPGLLTVRAAELLARAQVVFYDALVDPAVLDWCAKDAELVAAGKRAGRPSARQEEINGRMIAAAREGRLVVRLKGGDPFVFGRGGEEVLELARAGIPVEVVPGVSAATAGPALAGIPLTHRGVAASFAVTTARRSDGRLHDFRDLAGVDTLVVMMVVDSLEAVTSQLLSAGRPRSCPVALVEAASTSRQRVVRGELADIAGKARPAGIQGPALLVAGDVVAVLDPATEQRSARPGRPPAAVAQSPGLLSGGPVR